MLKKHLTLGLMTCMLGISGLARAQAIPTASSSSRLQIGVGGTFLNPDYGQKNNTAITIYGDFDRTRHFGLEADATFGISTPDNVKENSYLGGARGFIRHGRYQIYGKGLAGIATFNLNNSVNNKSYFVFGIGGGVDVKITRKINVRGDYTVQEWTTFSPNNLSPSTGTVGVAYSF